jgi:DNA-nicking Smr family endonuclease
MKRPKNKRPLTPEEKELWRYVTRNDIPLNPETETSEAEFDVSRLAPPPAAKPPAIKKWKPGMHAVPPQIKTGDASFSCGQYAGIDRSTAERFRKGNYPIDAALDLHGMTRDRAFTALMAFLHTHARAGSRCLLVITGKGGKPPTKEAGVLKALVPRWLAEPEPRGMLLAIDNAQPKHGGSGAYYLLLKRKR